MKRVIKILSERWYLVLLVAICIFAQCYLQLMLPEYMGNIQNAMPQAGFTDAQKQDAISNILIQGGYMVLISFAVVVLAIIQGYFNSFLGAYVGKRMRYEMFHKINRLSLTNYNKFGTATLITRTTNDIEQVKNLVFMTIRTLVMSPTYMIIALIKILNSESRLAIVLAICIPLILVVMGILMFYTTPIFKRMQEKTDNVTVVLRENLTGIRVIRAYNQQDTENNKFDKANTDMTNIIIKIGRIMSVANPTISIVFNLCYVGIYALGFYLLEGVNVVTNADAISKTITNVAVTSQYSMQIMMSFMMFAMLFIMIPQGSASSKRINEVLNIQNKIQDVEETP